MGTGATTGSRHGPDGPEVSSSEAVFRFADPHRRLRGVRLAQEVGLAADGLTFTHRRGVWTLVLPRPAVDRLEYLVELEAHDGSRSTVTDPGNPRRAPGAFGDKSVVEFPGYRAPTWTTTAAPAGTRRPFAIRSTALGATVRGELWAPADLPGDVAAALVVVHDGPEFDALGGLLRWAAVTVDRGEVPPFRVALLAPGDRNRWYAVNPAYARGLSADVLPALGDLAPTGCRIGVGASLGALAMLHVHRLAPTGFDGLFLQSGSFFTPTLDAQERRFPRFGPVTRFVGELAQAVADPAPVPVTMTCGEVEENLANNRSMASALRRLQYPVRFHEVRDAHNFTAWRDALDPHLTRLVLEATDAA